MAVILTLLFLLPAGLARAQSAGDARAIDPERFEQHLNALTQGANRTVGSEGYQASLTHIRDTIATLADQGLVEVREQSYPVSVPVTRTSELRVGDETIDVFPLWPAHARLNALPKDGLTGRLIYAGNGSAAEVPPRSVRGNIAVLEASARGNWPRVFEMGASALLVLGDESIIWQDLRDHLIPVPADLPRAYVPVESAEAIRQLAKQGTVQATLDLQADWEERQATNLYAVVPAADGSSALPMAGALASFDTAGLVYDRTPGAGTAVQPAALLAMLEAYAAEPGARPMLFAFIGGDAQQHIGTREMMMALAQPPRDWREALEKLAEQHALDEADLVRLREVGADPTKLSPTEDRRLIRRVAELADTEATSVQEELFRLRIQRRSELNEQQLERLADLEARFIELGVVRNALRNSLAQMVDDPEQLAAAKKYAGQLLERLGGVEGDPKRPGLVQQNRRRAERYQERIALYEWLAGLAGVSKDPQDRDSAQRALDVLFGLDLSDRGVRVALLGEGQLLESGNAGLTQGIRDWFTRLNNALQRQKLGESSDGVELSWLEPIRERIVLNPFTQNSTLRAGPLALPTEMAQAWGVPAMTFASTDDLRLRRDTPADTMRNLDIGAIREQLVVTDILLRRLRDDPSFAAGGAHPRKLGTVTGQVVSVAPGKPVPDLPRRGFWATYFYGTMGGQFPSLRDHGYALGVRRTEMRPVDEDGRYRFEGLPTLDRSATDGNRRVLLQVFRFEPGTGQVVAVSDGGKTHADLSPALDLNGAHAREQKSVPFEAAEFPLVGLYDPRYLQSLNTLLLMDARRNAEPQKFNALVRDRIMAGFIEPEMKAYLLFRYGQVGNRLMLLNLAPPTEQTEAGANSADPKRTETQIGFSVEELREIDPLSLVTSEDFHRVDADRLALMARAGVTSPLLDDLHASAGKQIEAARAALQNDDGEALLEHSNGAWATEALVYAQAQAMADDVIRAAIFLLLLCVPFAFCMERLLFASANVYRQIVMALGIFIVMCAALWSFHPAFQISTSPLIIVLAFAILLMSGLVIWVIYSRFDSELRKIRTGKTGSATGANFARASVLSQAIMLGIANMRRRKFRTALTAITIILITFAVITFTSSTTVRTTTSLPTGDSADYPGVMLRHRGFRPIPGQLTEGLAAVFPNRQFIERWWAIDPLDEQYRYTITALPPSEEGEIRTARVQALLGLMPGESAVSRVDEVLGTEAFSRLESGEWQIIYLPQTVAEELGVAVGETVRVGGIDLEVAGLYDADAFDQKVRLLSDEPMTPLDYAAGTLDASGQKLTDINEDALDLGEDAGAAEVDASYQHVSAVDMAILPVAAVKLMPEADLRVLTTRLEDDKAVAAVTDELTRRYSLATFAGDSDGVRLVAASQPTSTSGEAVVIPLAIGGLIIFNTMMGSIAERRREIHIYTSLGLAPLHVGALFVAEALTYGLIGSVIGYVIGQLVGTLLLQLGWLGTATLNYSGTSAMLTLGLILLVVLLSALVPARLASKIAAPSIDRTWKVPAPKDGVIRAQLPFTINATAAQGALAYLHEFFDMHSDGTIGRFSTDDIEPFRTVDDKGRASNGLRAAIWLTPFDLGVRQQLELTIDPSDVEGIYDVNVRLERVSGDDDSWYRMNRTFLTELRKQFLQWRSLSPQRMLEYVEESKKMFEQERHEGTEARRHEVLT